MLYNDLGVQASMIMIRIAVAEPGFSHRESVFLLGGVDYQVNYAAGRLIAVMRYCLKGSLYLLV